MGAIAILTAVKQAKDSKDANDAKLESSVMRSNEGSVVGMNKKTGNALASGVSSGILQSITGEKAQKDDDIAIGSNDSSSAPSSISGSLSL